MTSMMSNIGSFWSASRVASQSESAAAACEGKGLSKKTGFSVLQKAVNLTDTAIDYMSSVFFDIGRAVDYSTQWIDRSGLSSDVKVKTAEVKSGVDRFNLVASACEVASAAKSLFWKEIESGSEAVDAVGGFVSSTADLAGRLEGLDLISLGKASPLIGGVGAIADSSLGLNGIRQGVQEAIEGDRTVVSAILKVAKNITLVALGVLCGIAAYFAAIAVTSAPLSLGILASATLFLTLKTAGCFYDRIVPQPLSFEMPVVEDVPQPTATFSFSWTPSK